MIPCAEFLCKHRTDQLHNHEIIISGAIGILGILLDREDLIEFALHQKYGLYYQLEHGVLEDYFWFEGSPAYHYYALEAFFRFEVFARHTPYHQLSHPYYREMFQMPLKLLQPDLTFPLLNDMKPEQGKLSAYQGLYEFAYSFYGDWEFAWVLSKTEALEGKAILESFFFGKEVDLGDKEMEFTNYHHGTGSGLTILRGDNESYLLFKHSPFGGEHDHYDRLATSFSAFGEKMITDLGTTGYGALLHYDYYKNTGSHNTVMINEENQPPANPTLYRYQQEQDMVLIDAEVKWDNSFKELDSHTRVEWDEESYKDVSMRRILLWCNQYYIEVFLVQAPTPKTIDWVMNIGGNLKKESNFIPFPHTFSEKKPFNYLHDVKYAQCNDFMVTDWEFEKCNFSIHSYMTSDHTLYYAKGPSNPSIDDISYLINRVEGKNAIYLNVFEAYEQKDKGIKDLCIHTLNQDGVTLTLMKDETSVRHHISFK